MRVVLKDGNNRVYCVCVYKGELSSGQWDELREATTKAGQVEGLELVTESGW